MTIAQGTAYHVTRIAFGVNLKDLKLTLASGRRISALMRASSPGSISLDPMGDSSTTHSDSLPFSLLATSILGIKGPLRLRPHGSTQKPHLVLRRVEIPEDSSENGEATNIVRFSLFAAKRIEVKPGKEILLTVASPDGYFKDQAVVFEADLTVSEEISDKKSDTHVAEEEDVYLPPAGEAIPPKMRRAWTRKVEDVGFVTRKCSLYVFFNFCCNNFAGNQLQKS